MRRNSSRALRSLWIAGFCFVLLFPINSTSQDKADEDISFQISAPKMRYRPGERGLVIFIVKNQGTTPIYLSRSFICGTWTGYVDFRVLDSPDHKKNGGCAVSELPIPMDKLKREVTESPGWLRLDPGEIYGQEVPANGG